MYQAQIAGLKQDIIKNDGFEACQVSGDWSGIKILGVRKLPNQINQGRHHLFVDLGNYRGDDYFCLLNGSIRYSFNKPENEVGCHVDFYGSSNTLKIVGSKPNEYSQTLSGLTFAHTEYGHSSYYILAIKSIDYITTPPLLNPNRQLILIDEIEQRLNELKGLVK
jgi:hypothetical protein